MPGKEQNKNDHTNHYFFFSQIVADDDDFIGFVAYTIYKKNKIEYIEQFKIDNSRPPTDEELLRWQHEECTDNKKKNYRSLAENKVNQFINELRGKREKELKKEKEENDERRKELDKRERNINNREKYCNVKSKYQFGSGILQSFIATLIYVVLGFIFITCGGVDVLTEIINADSK